MSRDEAMLETLDELTELGMDVVRTLLPRLTAAVGDEAHALAREVDNASRTVRRCLILSRWLIDGAPFPEARAPRPAPEQSADAEPAPGAAEAAKPEPPERPETVEQVELVETVERVEYIDFGPDPASALVDGRFAAAVDGIRREFRIIPGRDNSPEVLVRRMIRSSRRPALRPASRAPLPARTFPTPPGPPVTGVVYRRPPDG